MRANRPLDFDGLETRQLLTKLVRPGPPTLAGHEVHAMVEARPVALDGTLTTNPGAKRATLDDSGQLVISMPVRGTLGGVGAVRGNWVQVQDANGRLTGADSLRLRNAQGALTVEFRNPLANASGVAKLGKAHAASHAPTVATTPQLVTAGTQAYDHATESGTITLTTDAAGRAVRRLALATNAGIGPR